MQTVEIAQLAKIEYGVGLLWFVYIGCIIAGGLQATKGIRGLLRGWEIANLLFWILSFVFGLVKLIALIKLSDSGPMYRREDGPYGISHQITDDGISVGFYAILAILEVSLMFSKTSSETAMAVRLTEQVEGKA